MLNDYMFTLEENKKLHELPSLLSDNAQHSIIIDVPFHSSKLCSAHDSRFGQRPNEDPQKLRLGEIHGKFVDTKRKLKTAFEEDLDGNFKFNRTHGKFGLE
jgi:hypothetical protein